MWPDKVLRRFQAVPPNPKECDFHGPYNKLLHAFFPPDSDFIVIPRYLQPSSGDPADFKVFSFEIQFGNQPVLILELNDPSAISLVSTRGKADDQIRSRIGDLAGHCPLRTMHAVSALGTALCFYSLNTADDDGEILPLQIPQHPTKLNDYAPANRWEYNILGEGGEAKLRAIIEEVLQGCAALPVDAQWA